MDTVNAEHLKFESRWGRLIVTGAGVWIGVVLAISFWRAWDIPQRLPDINRVATIHLFLFPVSLLGFLALSWVRQMRDQSGASHARWRMTVILWLLVILHPVSCALYPAVFDLDRRTVEGITAVVSTMRVGMPREEVERKILALNRSLPVSMSIDPAQHEAEIQEAAQYLSTTDVETRRRLRATLGRATLVFVPVEKETQSNRSQEVFQRRLRSSSDIGVDRIEVRYEPADRLEKLVYSSNRQLTEVRAPCTIHFMVPAPPEAAFPYPCSGKD